MPTVIFDGTSRAKLDSGPSCLSNNERDTWHTLTAYIHGALYAHKLSRTASVYHRTNSAMIVLACQCSTKLARNIEDHHTDAGDGNGRGSKNSGRPQM